MKDETGKKKDGPKTKPKAMKAVPQVKKKAAAAPPQPAKAKPAARVKAAAKPAARLKVSPPKAEAPAARPVSDVKKAEPQAVKAAPPREARPPLPETKAPAPKPPLKEPAAVKPPPAPAPKPARPPEPAPQPAPRPAPPAIEVEREEPPPAPEKRPPKIVEVNVPITVKELALLVDIRANMIISHLIGKGVFATINQNLGEDIVRQIIADLGFEYRKPAGAGKQDGAARDDEKADAAGLVHRAPVVTFMGHVDHGKTSLLDFIRKTRVADKEKGGITQHVGAYKVTLPHGSVTFLDTPGHEAFTAMRARGADATDVVVLVVAADDGVMPQTREAIDHARAAEVPIVIAINKCDLPAANIDKVKGQLAQIGLAAEGWGGKTITVPVSAKTGEGVDALLEMLLLEAEMLELKANPKIRARGVVIEGKLSSEQGPVATVLVKNGTLRLGDTVVSGMHYGKVKAMLNDRFERVAEAPPATPVSILGLSGVPMAGDEFFAVKDEKKARTLALLKKDEDRERRLRLSKRVTLESFYQHLKEEDVKEMCIILKADVQGSVEALQRSLDLLSTKEVKVHIVHSGVGTINESDVMLAVVSNAIIIGFNAKVEPAAEETAKKEGVDIRLYGIIYKALEDIEAAMEGLLEPVTTKVFLGRAQVRQVFRVSKVGAIAGSYVVKGKIIRSGIAHLVRDKKVVYEGKISSLKRFKDDAREVAENFECGIGLAGHDDIKEGDLIEVFQLEQVARKLSK